MEVATITSTSEGVTLSADIPLSAFQNAVAGCYGYQETINGEPNPEPRGVYAFKQVINILKGWAHNTASTVVNNDFDVEVSVDD